VFINDGEGDTMPLMAVNDTRRPAGGSVTVTDVESGKQVFAGSFSVERNGKTCVARLPRPAGQGVLMIRYKVDGKEYGNHYLYGRAPFRLSDYRKWMHKTGLYNMTSTPLSAM
jgi:beta-mannosidase